MCQGLNRINKINSNLDYVVGKLQKSWGKR